MLQSLKTRWSRRELFRRSALLTLPALFRGQELSAAAQASVGSAGLSGAPAGGLRVGQDIYQSIGVRPLINARGTFTIISGSRMLPEVRAAMDAAAQHHVHIDELMTAIGARLAELTKAEWGMVSSGCSAALTHATAACVAGGNPDLHVRIPHLDGFAKDEVIIPTHSRNVYDAAIRAVGVRIVEVSTAEELEAAFGPRTAMIYIFAGPQADKGPLSTQAIARMANQRRVPVLVDAAAEVLTVPNVHLQNGVTLVAYSGGKCIRGPQTAGLLLGRKGPGAGRVGPQRAASRLRALDEGGQGRSRRDADGRRNVDEARPQGRVDAMAVVARYHREAGVHRRRRDDVGDGNDGAVQPDAVARDSVGSEAPRHHRGGRRETSTRG
jgi:L-seryl-tRNA(Ser) seleniumtransferase